MSDNLDPEIEAMIHNSELYSDDESDDSDFLVDNGDIFDTNDNSDLEEGKEEVPQEKGIHTVDLTVKEFAPLEKELYDQPSDIYQDSSYYKTVLTGENQASHRFHQLLSKYLTSSDPRDRAVYRQQIITVYWELLKGMVEKMADPNVPMPKKMFVRFGILLPSSSLLRPETKLFFSKIIIENLPQEPILYMDEWFEEIASGRMNNSATDEKRPAKSSTSELDENSLADRSRLKQLLSKSEGKLQNAESQLKIKEQDRSMMEIELKGKVEELCEHAAILGMKEFKDAYSEAQKRLFASISDYLRRLSKNDKELVKLISEYKEAKETQENIQDKLNSGGSGGEVRKNDIAAVKLEFETVRQMSKMTVGRRGNQFPILTKEFFHCTENGTGTRENVIKILKWIESIDPGVFCRAHKNTYNRIVPYILLVPTYGDRGVCWEPFDKYNRLTSRGRIIVPMYPKDLRVAVLTAVADLRWQVAKEKASYYWMEEGLTGQYYQHCDKMKLKGDVKEFFIEDYILWIAKEASGVQRLDREVRGIFWRNMPFPKELKEDLRKRSLIYEELCKKDVNREMSDGY